MTSEDTVEDPLMRVQFYIKSKRFPFPVTVHLLFSFLLQKTLKSVFLQGYESLKLNHDTNYLMTSEETVEDPLRSVQFYLNSKFFNFVLQSIYCFRFHCKRRLNCISTTLWIFKTKQWHKLFDDIWRHGWRSVEECSILFKQQVFSFGFFSFVTVHLLFSFSLQKTLKLYFYHPMNL